MMIKGFLCSYHYFSTHYERTTRSHCKCRELMRLKKKSKYFSSCMTSFWVRWFTYVSPVGIFRFGVYIHQNSGWQQDHENIPLLFNVKMLENHFKNTIQIFYSFNVFFLKTLKLISGPQLDLEIVSHTRV